jgi:ribonuclease-3
MKRKLLSDKALTPISCRLGLADALIRGKGDCNNQKAVPSAYEAMAAAIYLDGGFGCAKKFVLSTLDFKGAMSQKDYISALQEELQAHGIQPPKYEKVECGTPQKPWFVAKICVDGKYYEGDGGSFSLAKLNAAKSAYEQIKKG